MKRVPFLWCYTVPNPNESISKVYLYEGVAILTDY